MGAVKYMGGYKVVCNLIVNFVELMGIIVLVVIYFDYGYYEDVFECIWVGYILVMFDGLYFLVEENFDKVCKVVEFVYVNGVLVEVEVGIIGGEEDGIIGDGELVLIEDVKVMVEIGIDFLAVGIGNIYGFYLVNWKGFYFDYL